MKINRLILIGIGFLCPLLFTACTRNTSSIHIRDFDILYSEDPLILNAQKSDGWQHLQSLLFFKMPHAKKSRFNYVWLRSSISITDEPSRYCNLFFKDLFMSNTVYINSIMIGTKPINRPRDLFVPTNYRIPPQALMKGNNELLIRLGIYGTMTKGSSKPDIEIQTKKDYDSSQFWDAFLFEYAFFGLSAVFITVIIMHILQFLIDRKLKVRLLYSLGLLINILILAPPFIPTERVDIDLILTYYFIWMPVIILYLALLIQAIYGIFLSNHNRIQALLMAVLFVLIVAAHADVSWQTIFTIVVLVVGFGYIGYILHRLHSIKSKRVMLYGIVSCMAVMFLVNMFSVLSPYLNLSCPDYINVYMMFFYLLMAIVYDARESKKQRMRILRLYEGLREPKSTKSARLAVSNASEEKLEHVIQLINDNYTSDLSREGLASAVDLNPNYFSTIFNAYTGKKINEYINGLRIKEAARQLAETDNKIIDIAFSVGFESLGTFIRTFKQEMGKTPSTYRDSIID